MDIKNNIFDLRDAILPLTMKKEELVLKKREMEVKMAIYNTRIRTSTKKLPDSEYKSICRKQDKLRSDILEIEIQLNDLNNQIRKKEILIRNLNREGLENGNQNAKSILDEIHKLKNKYIEFSSDSSRISSMRLMASQFIDDLENIIKKDKLTWEHQQF